MTIDLTLSNVIFLLMALISAFAGLIKVIVAQHERSLDKRFEKLEETRAFANQQLSKRLDTLDTAARLEANQWQRVERELLSLKADLPLQYVRREDYIRGQSVIEAKLDGLANKLENFSLRSLLAQGITLPTANPSTLEKAPLP